MNTLVIAATTGGLVSFLVWLIILGIVIGLLWWVLHQFPPPQPFLKVLEVIVVIVAVIILLNLLLSLVGHGFIVW